MRRVSSSTRYIASLALLVSASQIKAAVIPPIGLAPGSQYQLVFVTADKITAESTDIADYNSFVTAQAALNPSLPSGAQWHAVASTSAISATTNAPSSGLPVYNTQGIEVAVFSLYTPQLLAPIVYDQFGNEGAREPVWTGTIDGGNSSPAGVLGASAPILGDAFDRNGWLGGAAFANVNLEHMFALSTPLTIPEPSSIILAALGISGLAAWRMRNR